MGYKKKKRLVCIFFHLYHNLKCSYNVDDNIKNHKLIKEKGYCNPRCNYLVCHNMDHLDLYIKATLKAYVLDGILGQFESIFFKKKKLNYFLK